MTTAANDLLGKILDLSPEERRELVERAWEAVEAEDWELTPELKAELDRRIDEMEKHPEGGIPFEEFQRRMNERMARAKAGRDARAAL